MKKSSMFEKYPDVVEVDDLRKMLGGISRRLAYRLLAEQEIRCVKVSPYSGMCFLYSARLHFAVGRILLLQKFF